MSTKIDIEDIVDANSHNSAMGLTADWSRMFSLYALEDYESITDNPANSFNIFTHLTAQGAAKMMYEQQARINETNISTAILPKSLLNKLNSEELSGIFGTPAYTTVAFCIKKDDIIKYGVYDSDDDSYKLVVNKDLKATFESYPSFTLAYNVNIVCKHNTVNTIDSDTGESVTSTEYNIYAYYDMPATANDGMRNVFKIYNQYISSREMRFEGSTYIAFFVKMFQIERKEVEFYVSDPFTSDTTLVFDNLLVGVEVFRKKAASTTETLMTGYVEGQSLTSNSYNYSYDTKRASNNFNLIFSKMSDYTALSVGDTIRAVVYTTQGSVGNIEFPYMAYNLNDLIMEYNQDLAIANQNVLLNITALAFARDSEATGGADALTFEEIRTLLINKQYSRDILITNNEIINKGSELGLNISRIEQDLISMYYQAKDSLIYKNMVLSTGTNDLYFDLSNKDKLVNGLNYYLIEPIDVFKYNKNTKRYTYIKPFDGSNLDNSVELFNEYVDKYNSADDKEDVIEVSFPFYIRYENTANPKIQLYDMSINSIEYLNFTNYDESVALDKLDISHIKVYRNPFRGSNNGTFDSKMKNQYIVQFVVYTGENTLNKLYLQSQNSNNSLNYVNSSDETDYYKQYVTFDLSLTGINSSIKYIVNPVNLQITNVDTMVSDGYIVYQAYIETNNYISDNKELYIKGIKKYGSISLDYSNYLAVDSTVKINIVGKFNDSTNNPLNKTCIEYESDEINLVEYLDENFNINFDIESQIKSYESYENDIPYKYESLKRIKNENYVEGNEETLSITDPDYYKYKVEVNNSGEVIMNISDLEKPTPNYIYANAIGDLIFDYTEISEDEYNEGPSDLKEYYVYAGKTEDDENYYIKCENLTQFENGIKYYTAKVRIKHHSGDLIWYKYSYDSDGTETWEASDLTDSEVDGSPNYKHKVSEISYVGICKDVPWVNRLYMVGESMYEKIVDLYYDIFDRTDTIRKTLFDGGKIFIALTNTSGKSKKFSAYKLSTNSREYLNDLALSIKFKVKYTTNENTDYKNSLIKTATISYIDGIGDNNFTVDKLFEVIKESVPDIQYINIISINNYKNGEVQTILNNTEINDEKLTVSQTMTTDDDGDIDFEPDITIDVVQTEI